MNQTVGKIQRFDKETFIHVGSPVIGFQESCTLNAFFYLCSEFSFKCRTVERDNVDKLSRQCECGKRRLQTYKCSLHLICERERRTWTTNVNYQRELRTWTANVNCERVLRTCGPANVASEFWFLCRTLVQMPHCATWQLTNSWSGLKKKRVAVPYERAGTCTHTYVIRHDRSLCSFLCRCKVSWKRVSRKGKMQLPQATISDWRLFVRQYLDKASKAIASVLPAAWEKNRKLGSWKHRSTEWLARDRNEKQQAENVENVSRGMQSAISH